MKTFLLTLATLFGSLALQAATKADFVVACDGSGDFESLQAAIDAVPDHAGRRYVIEIRNGLYDKEKLVVPQSKPAITFRGESRTGTVVSYHMYNFPSPETGGLMPAASWELWRENPWLVRTSATIIVLADGCRFEELTIENTAEPLGQALAVAVRADRAVFLNCDLKGYQDTVLLWRSEDRAYFRNCLIVGRTDYIYGGSTAYFDRCEIRSFGGGWVTAPSTTKEQFYGFVFDRCRFTYLTGSPRPEDDGRPFALGRPWHNYPKVAILRSELCAEVDPAGWPTEWDMPYAPTSEDLHLYEYRNMGPGADMSRRSRWVGLKELSPHEARAYRIQTVLGEHPRRWK